MPTGRRKAACFIYGLPPCTCAGACNRGNAPLGSGSGVGGSGLNTLPNSPEPHRSSKKPHWNISKPHWSSKKLQRNSSKPHWSSKKPQRNSSKPLRNSKKLQRSSSEPLRSSKKPQRSSSTHLQREARIASGAEGGYSSHSGMGG